jgi:hypothetical protein
MLVHTPNGCWEVQYHGSLTIDNILEGNVKTLTVPPLSTIQRRENWALELMGKRLIADKNM